MVSMSSCIVRFHLALSAVNSLKIYGQCKYNILIHLNKYRNTYEYVFINIKKYFKGSFRINKILFYLKRILQRFFATLAGQQTSDPERCLNSVSGLCYSFS